VPLTTGLWYPAVYQNFLPNVYAYWSIKIFSYTGLDLWTPTNYTCYGATDDCWAFPTSAWYWLNHNIPIYSSNYSDWQVYYVFFSISDWNGNDLIDNNVEFSPWCWQSWAWSCSTFADLSWSSAIFYTVFTYYSTGAIPYNPTPTWPITSASCSEYDLQLSSDISIAIDSISLCESALDRQYSSRFSYTGYSLLYVALTTTSYESSAFVDLFNYINDSNNLDADTPPACDWWLKRIQQFSNKYHPENLYNAYQYLVRRDNRALSCHNLDFIDRDIIPSNQSWSLIMWFNAWENSWWVYSGNTSTGDISTGNAGIFSDISFTLCIDNFWSNASNYETDFPTNAIVKCLVSQLQPNIDNPDNPWYDFFAKDPANYCSSTTSTTYWNLIFTIFSVSLFLKLYWFLSLGSNNSWATSDDTSNQSRRDAGSF